MPPSKHDVPRWGMLPYEHSETAWPQTKPRTAAKLVLKGLVSDIEICDTAEWASYVCPPGAAVNVMGSSAAVIENWEADLRPAIERLTTTLISNWRQASGIAGLERDLAIVKMRLVRLEQTSPVTTVVNSLAPEPYEILKPFYLVVEAHEEEFIASFFDAGISATGESREEAIYNLKDMIVATFEGLSRHTDSELGVVPFRQLQTLREFIRKKH